LSVLSASRLIPKELAIVGSTVLENKVRKISGNWIRWETLLRLLPRIVQAESRHAACRRPAALLQEAAHGDDLNVVASLTIHGNEVPSLGTE
jgi:hypothetical protein